MFYQPITTKIFSILPPPPTPPPIIQYFEISMLPQGVSRYFIVARNLQKQYIFWEY